MARGGVGSEEQQRDVAKLGECDEKAQCIQSTDCVLCRLSLSQ